MRDKANLSAWRRKHRLANLEKIRAYERAQYYKHKEKKLANVTAWSKANPEKVKTAKQKYKIKNNRILGHSDIAPLRKTDPGKFFPWAELNKFSLGSWVKTKKNDAKLSEIEWLDSLGFPEENTI